MGRKCNVLDCLSDSKRTEDNGVTFHKMPFHSDLRPKWMELCRIPEDRQTNKIVYVCSRHFRRTDFCNFKGTKYMLRQGALPSVFPWSKPVVKLQPLDEPVSTNSGKVEENDNVEIKLEPKEDEPIVSESKVVESKLEPAEDVKPEEPKIKAEIFTDNIEIPAELPLFKDQPLIMNQANAPINFAPGTMIETNDFDGKWYAATIAEVDYEDNEVLVDFDKQLNKASEWIPMDSPRLRPKQLRKSNEKFELGEKCMATWVNKCKKFPATINKVLDGDKYEVLFDDGILKVLKAHKLSKLNTNVVGQAPLHAAPLFDPVVGSKEERRERKRKLNVAQLFAGRKRPKVEAAHLKNESLHEEDKYTLEEKPDPENLYSTFNQAEGEEWTCRWLNGEPVGTESKLETSDGFKRSIVVPDHRLPPGWVKHLTQRLYGFSAGKWETVLVSPESKRFHNRHSIKSYLDEHKLNYHLDQFDFCLHLNRARKLGLYEVTNPELLAAMAAKSSGGQRAKGTPKSQSTRTPTTKAHTPNHVNEQATANDGDGDQNTSLKIMMENDSYKCPIDGCGKNFRKENLAQMHIKHYHPEYTKFIGFTPNVADLAYARTVGEPFDDFVPKINEKEKTQKIETIPKLKVSLKILPPKNFTPETDGKKSITKDMEIIKLLNSEPKSAHDFESITDVKNTIDKVEESEHRTGIKTLLPVVKTTDDPPVSDSYNIDVEAVISSHAVSKNVDKPRARKRNSSENDLARKRRLVFKYDTDETSDYYEGDSHSRDSFKKVLEGSALPAQESPQTIIEGGQVIRLVHMRSEEIINCTCGVTEEDGLMVQCELCLCWQHGHCHNIHKETDVPDKYVCYICRNPQRMRLSKKYIHDQDWLKQGTLPTTNFQPKDQEALAKRFEKLRKSHDLNGYLIELREYMHNLRIKLNVAQSKNHPKLYLWAKPWEKIDPNAVLNLKSESKPVKEELFSGSDHSYIKNTTFGDIALQTILEEQTAEVKLKKEDLGIGIEIDSKTNLLDDSKIKSESELISILESGDNIALEQALKLKREDDFPKVDLNTLIANNLSPIKSDVKDCILSKEPTLNTITNGLLGTGSLDLALAQCDLERLSALAQLSEVEPVQLMQAPQPEAAINSADCQMHLLEHVSYHQDLVEERLDALEAELNELEEQDVNLEDFEEGEDEYSKSKQMLQMLIRDLSTVRQIATLNY